MSYGPLVVFRAYPSLFGLGPAVLPLHNTYLEYLRATNAMEHVPLAFVRWQDAPSNELSGSFGGGPGSAAQILDSGLPSHVPGTSPSIKEARQAPTSPWSTYRVHCPREAERPDVYARSCQDCCKLGYSTPQRGDSCSECIRTISRLGASGSTTLKLTPSIRRRF